MNESKRLNPRLAMSPIPLVHARTDSAPSPSGVNYRRPSEQSYGNPGIPGTALRINPKGRYNVEDGFDVTAPRSQRTEPPRLLAHNAQFVKPYQPPPLEMLDESTNVETQVLFKKDLESRSSDNDWESKTVDPVIRDLRMALVQAKPEDIYEYIHAYAISLLSKGEVEIPQTVDRDDYERQQRKMSKSRDFARSRK